MFACCRCCWLFVVVMYCWLLRFDVRCLLIVDCCLLFVDVCCLLLLFFVVVYVVRCWW